MSEAQYTMSIRYNVLNVDRCFNEVCKILFFTWRWWGTRYERGNISMLGTAFLATQWNNGLPFPCLLAHVFRWDVSMSKLSCQCSLNYVYRYQIIFKVFCSCWSMKEWSLFSYQFCIAANARIFLYCKHYTCCHIIMTFGTSFIDAHCPLCPLQFTIEQQMRALLLIPLWRWSISVFRNCQFFSKNYYCR